MVSKYLLKEMRPIDILHDSIQLWFWLAEESSYLNINCVQESSCILSKCEELGGGIHAGVYFRGKLTSDKIKVRRYHSKKESACHGKHLHTRSQRNLTPPLL